ncbi:MAG TPA: hypothetical protein VFX48_09360 [Saprospiraceae bacterium]|nr:hypothetical protein [Saprospiraceae bacterium]
MRHLMTWVCLFIWTGLPGLFAQAYTCGWTAEGNPPSAGASPCFDVERIFRECTPVYVRVNLHFFVATNCNGMVQQLGTDQESVYKISEDMIRAANAEWANNQVQRRSGQTGAPCNPIRFVLKGVYQHCLSNAAGVYNTPNLLSAYGVNPETEINFFIASGGGTTTGIGYHGMRCGSATAFHTNTWWTVGNFIHELGHILNLYHSFDGDDHCGDTPRILYDWDKDCDGVMENHSDSKKDETDLKCWNKIDPGKVFGQAGYSDINENAVHDCDETAPCTDCPCCDANNIDNNVMSYSAQKTALTECQIRRMLSDLSGFNCGLLERIGGCPPATAFVSLTARDLADPTSCSECLILEASTNEEQYELRIYEIRNGQEVLVYQSGWKAGTAGRFCYKTSQAFSGLANYLKPGVLHRAVLTTKNSCSEDRFRYDFTTNTRDCTTVDYEPLDISPNPAYDQITLGFRSNQRNAEFQIAAKHLITGKTSILKNRYPANYGLNSLNLDVSALAPGSYSMLVAGQRQIFQNNFVKIQ